METAPVAAPAIEAPEGLANQPPPMEDDFGSLRNAIRGANPNNTLEVEKTKEQPKEQKKDVSKETAKEAKPKSIKDRLKVQEDESEQEEAPETSENEEDDLPTYKNRVPTEKEKATWKGLKETKTKYDELLPKFQELEKQFNELKEKPVFADDVTKELEELRRFRDMTDFKQSDFYRKEVSEPMESVQAELSEIVDTFKIEQSRLAKALTETSTWKRNMEIDKVLQDADDEVPGGVAQTIRDRAAQMHDIWKKEAEMEAEAGKGKAAYEADKRKEIDRKSLAEKQAWEKARTAAVDEVKNLTRPLLGKLGDEKSKELLEAMNAAEISDEPSERALQAIAPQLAATLIEHLNEQYKENAKLKKDLKALSSSKPGTTQTTGEEAKRSADDEDDDGLFKSIRRYQGR